MYYSVSDGTPGNRSINYVAFAKGAGRSYTAGILTPLYTQSNELWLHWSCSMLGMVEVWPCIIINNNYSQINSAGGDILIATCRECHVRDVGCGPIARWARINTALDVHM